MYSAASLKAAVNNVVLVLIYSKSCMFFGVFRFAKEMKFLNKGGIYSISRSSRGTFIVCMGPHLSK